jgi:formate hydrogenlyase subunit 4
MPLPASLGLAVLQAAVLLALAPLVRGGARKLKAAFQGRLGPPLLQAWYDLAKLLRKEPVRSDVSSWVFVAGPRVYFATAVAATALVPAVFAGAPLEQAGGVIVLVGLLALGRFALAAAALDTGSPFGGMGSSREMTVAALVVSLFTVALWGGSLNLGDLVRTASQRGLSAHPSDLLAAAALFVVLIAEAGRVPVDNPDTHLELTMIHEAMVLEYSGADLALVEWASALKELLFMTVLVNLFLPVGLASSAGALEVAMASALYLGKLFLLAVALTLVEVTNAKLRLFRVPELMAACFGLGFLALAIRFL